MNAGGDRKYSLGQSGNAVFTENPASAPIGGDRRSRRRHHARTRPDHCGRAVDSGDVHDAPGRGFRHFDGGLRRRNVRGCIDRHPAPPARHARLHGNRSGRVSPGAARGSRARHRQRHHREFLRNHHWRHLPRITGSAAGALRTQVSLRRVRGGQHLRPDLRRRVDRLLHRTRSIECRLGYVACNGRPDTGRRIAALHLRSHRPAGGFQAHSRPDRPVCRLPTDEDISFHQSRINSQVETGPRRKLSALGPRHPRQQNELHPVRHHRDVRRRDPGPGRRSRGIDRLCTGAECFSGSRPVRKRVHRGSHRFRNGQQCHHRRRPDHCVDSRNSRRSDVGGPVGAV